MAKVVVTLEDTPDGVEVSVNFEPDLPADLTEDKLDELSEAQLLGLEIMDFLDQEEDEEEED
jgi:hypothetical protein